MNSLARRVGGPTRPVAYANVGFAKLYNHKTRLTAADLLSDHVIPCYETHDIAFQSVLIDRGTECGAGAISLIIR